MKVGRRYFPSCFHQLGPVSSSASQFKVAEDGTFSYSGSSNFFVCTSNANDIAWSIEDSDHGCDGSVAVKLIAKAADGPASDSTPKSTGGGGGGGGASSAPASAALYHLCNCR